MTVEAIPSQESTPDRLLQAGLSRARADGLRKLTVRSIAQDAGVNLGSFVYHFGSRDAFIAQLIEHWYAPLMARTQSMLALLGTRPLTLKDLVLDLIDWVLQERQFIGHLVMDAASGEHAAQAFLRGCGDRHPALLLAAIEAAQHAGQVRAEDPRHVLLFLVSAIGLPVLLLESLGGRHILPTELVDAFETFSLEREHVAKRLDWVLQGLSPVPCAAPPSIPSHHA
ncbi:MAG: TetR/AcrR family transcriptional regulator [Burkholderiales bacterium]|nr:TetR/AcrR family transcriptional regulator [Burkholderiales bacterium]